MRRKRRIQRAILLREGDYCCDQAQFAAPPSARGNSSQKLNIRARARVNAPMVSDKRKPAKYRGKLHLKRAGV
jgi:hypothetical protein